MKKIISLFKRDYEGSRLVLNEVVEGAEWVLSGEGVATVKLDGTACMIRGGNLFKRYDRKVNKGARKRGSPFIPSDFKPAPPGWEPAEVEPNLHTGHWPGWSLVGGGPEDVHHNEGFANLPGMPDGTYELCGPKVQGNPYGLEEHLLYPHGEETLSDVPRDYEGIRSYFLDYDDHEGIVWYHPDGRMVKIKRRDFGFEWPIQHEN